MKVFTYSEARQNLSKLLILAQKEEIEIRRRDGAVFSLRSKKNVPFKYILPETNVTADISTREFSLSPFSTLRP